MSKENKWYVENLNQVYDEFLEYASKYLKRDSEIKLINDTSGKVMPDLHPLNITQAEAVHLIDYWLLLAYPKDAD